MLTLDAEDIVRLRSPGGDRFATFANSVIRAHSRACGVPDAAVRTNLQTNLGDGGVDAEVTEATTRDPAGWLAHPTVWQFKSSTEGKIQRSVLRAEINKEYAKRRVEEGYAYYMCVCAHLTPERKEHLESSLREFAAAINPEAPQPRMLGADDLATLASMYPAIVLPFRPNAASSALSLSSWGASATAFTPRYVERSELEPVRSQILQHVDFDRSPIDPVYTIGGPSGAGKTRFVYEALSKVSGAEGLVLYFDEEVAAFGIARQLANGQTSAILVVDETSANGRQRLQDILVGCRGRVRVVALDSTDSFVAQKEGAWIDENSREDVDEILARNFPEVPRERRRAYAYLSENFVRFAVDLCRHDAETPANLILSRTPFIEEYFTRRLNGDEQRAIGAIALVNGVGFKGDRTPEFDRLCSLLELSRSSVRETIARLHHAPGFVATAGRYWLVKPPIVAQVAFKAAWRLWAEPDLDKFLQGLADHPRLLEGFLRRVAESASYQVRTDVARYFRAWAQSLDPATLSFDDIERLLILVEVDFRTFLPLLRQLVDHGSLTQFIVANDDEHRCRGVGHELIRTARRLAALPECFYDAEAILLQFAQIDFDTQLRDQAVRDYSQLFKIVLSGTALPFLDRLDLLKERVQSNDKGLAALAIDVLCDILESHTARVFDEPLVAGRVPPPEWQPGGVQSRALSPEETVEVLLQAKQERETCITATVELLSELIANGVPSSRERAWANLATRIGDLIRLGQAPAIRDIFPPSIVSAEIRAQILAEIRWQLREGREVSEEDSQPARTISTEDENELKLLAKELQPSSLHDRLVAAIGVERWRLGGHHEDSPWWTEIRGLAKEIVGSPEALESELDWLFSDEAKNAYDLGTQLGILDVEGRLFDAVLNAANTAPSANFALGYVRGLTTATSSQNDRLNHFLDNLEAKSPLVAFYLAANAGKAVRVVERATRLVESGSVPAVHLRVFCRDLEAVLLSDDDFRTILGLLVQATEHNDTDSDRVALELAVWRLRRDSKRPKAKQIVRLKRVRSLLWRLLEATIGTSAEADGWVMVVATLAPTDPRRASQLAIQALGFSSVYRYADVERRKLSSIAKTDPQTAMTEIGELILGHSTTPVSSTTSFREVIEALPLAVVTDWLTASNVEGAVALSMHLPTPHIDSNGTLHIPELTDHVMSRFGADQRVVDGLCRGTFLEIELQDISGQYSKRRTLISQIQSVEADRRKWVRDWARSVREEGKEFFDVMGQLDTVQDEARFG